MLATDGGVRLLLVHQRRYILRTYIRSITTFFRWTHRDSLRLLTRDEWECLAVEALASKAMWS